MHDFRDKRDITVPMKGTTDYIIETLREQESVTCTTAFKIL